MTMEKQTDQKPKKPRRERGTDSIHKQGNKYVGRLDVTEELGRKPNGARNIKCFSGDTEAEVKRKIREYQKQGTHIPVKTISFGEYPNYICETFMGYPDTSMCGLYRLQCPLGDQICQGCLLFLKA